MAEEGWNKPKAMIEAEYAAMKKKSKELLDKVRKGELKNPPIDLESTFGHPKLNKKRKDDEHTDENL